MPQHLLHALTAAATFLLLWRQAVASQRAAGQEPWPWLSLGLAGLVFLTPGQWELWTMASAQSFLLVLFASAGLIAATSMPRSGWRTLLALVAGLGATFTVASGLFFWPVAAGASLLAPDPKGVRRAAFALHLTVGGLLWLGFLVAWSRQDVRVAPDASPLQIALYALVWLGAPLDATSVHGAGVVGALGLVGMGVLMLRPARALRESTLPWLALAAFSGLGGIGSAIGRAGLGTDQALAPRYQAQAYLFWAALFVLLVLHVRRPEGGRAWVAPLALLSLLAVDGLATPGARQLWERRAARLRVAQAELPDVCPGNLGLLAVLHPKQERVLQAWQRWRGSGLTWLGFTDFSSQGHIDVARMPPAGALTLAEWVHGEAGGQPLECLALRGRVPAQEPATLAVAHQGRVLKRLPVGSEQGMHPDEERRGWVFRIEIMAARLPPQGRLAVVLLSAGGARLVGWAEIPARAPGSEP